MKENGRSVMPKGSTCVGGIALPAPWRAQVGDLSTVPASFEHPSATCRPLAGQQHDAGVSEGVRAVADPGAGRGRRLFGAVGQLVTPAAANTGSLSASCPENTSPVVAVRHARSSARGAGSSAAAGSGQRLSSTEPSTGPLCGERGQMAATRSPLPLCVTKYRVALSHQSLLQRRVWRDLVILVSCSPGCVRC